MAQFSVCYEVQRFCNQNHNLVSSYSCFSRGKSDIASFPKQLQGTGVSLPPAAFQGAAFCRAHGAPALGPVWQGETKFLQLFCCTRLTRELQPQPKLNETI